MNIDLYPEKAQYLTGEPVKLIAQMDFTPPEESIAVLSVCHLSESVCTLCLPAKKFLSFSLRGFSYEFAGFGAELSILKSGMEIASAQTAFDVVAQHNQMIRYGFLSDFGSEENECTDVENLRKFHINMVQYYDWSYRHDNLVSSESQYADMMGRQVDLDTVKTKIAACCRFGMKSLGYGAVYAASKAFFEEHPDWALYTAAGDPFVFIDTFYLMNIVQTSSWHGHIVNEYAKAVSQVGFDGIHMDTYGFPKTAFTSEGKMIRLDAEYPRLINDAKERLNQVQPENYLIFNNVGNWPVRSVADTKQDAIYIEVWEPYSRYGHIKQIILDAERACGNKKQVILAAYLAPFRIDTPERALNAALLLTATIAANGATHLLLGEKNGVLTQGYYVDHSTLTEEQAGRLRTYYDFLVVYMEILYNRDLHDVSFTHIGWDNTEYRCLSHAWSPDGRSGALWLTIRESDHLKCINVINLIGCENDVWNQGKNAPVPQTEVAFEVQVDKKIGGIFFASPDRKELGPQSLDYRLKCTDRGITAAFSLPYVDCWSMVYLVLEGAHADISDIEAKKD
ncbi:MAG: hypothetical protein E7572_11690 [Ruminococcaceae bacterium]|nr:hypothetical protein [Oscillospiraceae bacterium]